MCVLLSLLHVLQCVLIHISAGNKARRASKAASQLAENTTQQMFDSMAHQDEQLRLNKSNTNKSASFAFTNIIPPSSAMTSMTTFNLKNVTINSKFLNLYMSKTRFDPYFQVICSVLNDKIYQLYIEHSQKINAVYDKWVMSLFLWNIEFWQVKSGNLFYSFR